MALDGITIHALVHEFNNNLLNGKINKISQPEKEELLITINTSDGNKRLLISANASLPFMYITKDNSPCSCPGLLYAFKKAHWRRQNYRDFSNGLRACCSLQDSALE